MQNQDHLTPKQLLGYANDSLSGEEKDTVGRHLLMCEECRKLLPPPTKEQFLQAVLGEKVRDDDEFKNNDEGESLSPGTMIQGLGVGFIFIGFLVFIGVGPGSPNPTDGARVAEVGGNVIGALILAVIGFIGIAVGTSMKR